MVTSGNCPNCGSTLPPGAIACARCGHKLAEPAPTEAPPAAGPTFQKPSAQQQQSIDLAGAFADVRKRWKVEHSNVFIAALAMAVLAFLISTIAGPSLVAAGDDAFDRRIDNGVWLQLAFGLALGAAALCILIRWESGPPEMTADTERIDFRVGAGLAGVTLLFMLLSLFKGFDGSFDGVDSWFRYAMVYAALVVAIFAISRPIPPTIGGTTSTMVGQVAIGIGAALLVIGQFMGLSNSNDTFVNGLAFQSVGIILMILSLGWFLGLQPKN
jgi:hypothetical protein